MHAGCHAESTGQIRFSTACSAGNKDVPVLCDVVTGSKAEDVRLIQLSAGMIIDVGNGSIRLFKACMFDEPFETVVLTAIVFSIYEQAKSIFEGKLLNIPA